jgi:HK97 family phage prohead protease
VSLTALSGAIRSAPIQAQVDAGSRRVEGLFAVYGVWTTIDNAAEGPAFRERFAAGAFAEAMAGDVSRIRALWHHGQDARVGLLPIAKLEVLQDRPEGAFYRMALLDGSYTADILAAAGAGELGASMRFSVPSGGQQVTYVPKPSSENPDGLPEVTILQARLVEVSLTSFPAYSATTAAVAA